MRLSLPFPQTFYGKSYQEISVSNAGVIDFDDRSMGSSTSPIPGDNDYGINTFIAPYWANLTYTDYIGVYYQVTGEAPKRNLIVQWIAMLFSNVSNFQVRFEEGNKDCCFYYNYVANRGAMATVGIQKDLLTGIQAFRNQDDLDYGLALQFRVPPPKIVTPLLHLLLLAE